MPVKKCARSLTVAEKSEMSHVVKRKRNEWSWQTKKTRGKLGGGSRVFIVDQLSTRPQQLLGNLPLCTLFFGNVSLDELWEDAREHWFQIGSLTFHIFLKIFFPPGGSETNMVLSWQDLWMFLDSKTLNVWRLKKWITGVGLVQSSLCRFLLEYVLDITAHVRFSSPDAKVQIVPGSQLILRHASTGRQCE